MEQFHQINKAAKETMCASSYWSHWGEKKKKSIPPSDAKGEINEQIDKQINK